MKQLVIAVIFITVTIVAAEPARLRSRFFARQEAAEAPDNGLYGAPPSPPPPEPQGSGYNYPKPEYGLPSEPTTPRVPEETEEPEAETQPSNGYIPPPLPPSSQAPENEERDLDQPTEDVESEAVAGGDENEVDNSQANQLRQFRRLVRPLKVVDGRRRQLQKLQRLVYYPVSARLESAQPVLATAAVPVAYVPENGFAYSTQVFHQQQW